MSEKVIFNGGQRRTYLEGEIPPVFERLPYDICEVMTDIEPLVFHPAFSGNNLVTTVDITEKI